MTSCDGSVILQVRLKDGAVVRRHKDHVKPRFERTLEPADEQSHVSDDVENTQAFLSSNSDETSGSNKSNGTGKSTEVSGSNGPAETNENVKLGEATEPVVPVATPQLAEQPAEQCSTRKPSSSPTEITSRPKRNCQRPELFDNSWN